MLTALMFAIGVALMAAAFWFYGVLDRMLAKGRGCSPAACAGCEPCGA